MITAWPPTAQAKCGPGSRPPPGWPPPSRCWGDCRPWAPTGTRMTGDCSPGPPRWARRPRPSCAGCRDVAYWDLMLAPGRPGPRALRLDPPVPARRGGRRHRATGPAPGPVRPAGRAGRAVAGRHPPGVHGPVLGRRHPGPHGRGRRRLGPGAVVRSGPVAAGRRGGAGHGGGAEQGDPRRTARRHGRPGVAGPAPPPAPGRLDRRGPGHRRRSPGALARLARVRHRRRPALRPWRAAGDAASPAGLRLVAHAPRARSSTDPVARCMALAGGALWIWAGLAWGAWNLARKADPPCW